MMTIAFFDVDGTLCNSSGKVLESTKQSIREFRDAGNLAYICTGRSKPEILDEILEVGFDGVIGAGGGYVVVENQVIKHLTMPKKAVIEIIAFFNQHDIGYYLESNDGLFGSDNCVRKIKEEIKSIAEKNGDSFEELDKKNKWFYNVLENHKGQDIDYGNVNKISFINNTVPFNDIANLFGEEFQMYHSTVPLFGPESGEIAVSGVDKKKAVSYVLEYLGIPREQAIAFGDGDNDISMFEAVGYGIAMGNATDTLKSIASEITTDADQDGIAICLANKSWVEK